MFLTRSEYDRSVNTFSPEGRLFQVEYAIEAIKLGSTAIGIQTEEGVVLAVEKRITSSLMEPSSIEKVVEIDNHLACAFSGKNFFFSNFQYGRFFIFLSNYKFFHFFSIFGRFLICLFSISGRFFKFSNFGPIFNLVPFLFIVQVF